MLIPFKRSYQVSTCLKSAFNKSYVFLLWVNNSCLCILVNIFAYCEWVSFRITTINVMLVAFLLRKYIIEEENLKLIKYNNSNWWWTYVKNR